MTSILTQEEFARLPNLGVLLVAPAGCGKTEALAMRAKALVESIPVESPRKLLALTFSNRARSNLGARLRGHLGPNFYRRITVANFHGLATRILLGHGSSIGIPSTVLLPEKGWRAARLRELGVGYDESADFERVLRDAKSDAADDETVLARLEVAGNQAALAFEKGLREEGRIDYDDQIRHASRILKNPEVARLYQAHFAATLVDEVQDLALSHLGIARGVSGGGITYAGDPSQGIYGFAGARPTEVFAEIRLSDPVEGQLVGSFRSSPAVLRAVNAVTTEMGDTPLECALPDEWTTPGEVLTLRARDTEVEAQVLFDHIEQVLSSGGVSIGVIARRTTRAADVREAASARGLVFEDWTAPTHVPRVVELLRSHVQRACAAEQGRELAALQALCLEGVDAADSETRDEIRQACVALEGLVEDGTSLRDAVAQCRKSPDPEAPVADGLHVLTGHLGKGQEFDWAIVLGLEEGHVPDFRSVDGSKLSEELRVLHVMVSRARHGLVATSAAKTRTKYGWRAANESRWFRHIEGERTGRLPRGDAG